MSNNSATAGAVPFDGQLVPYLATAPVEALERICEAHWNHGGEGVVFLDIHQHNATNHTLSGTIDIDGVVHGFIIDNGDWNGTDVRAWGDPEDVGTYRPGPPPEPLTFVPKDDGLFLDKPAMFQLYIYWRAQPWFKEKERNYAYDRHFQPGGKIEGYYRDWAATKGLKIGLLSNLPAGALALVRAAIGKAADTPASE